MIEDDRVKFAKFKSKITGIVIRCNHCPGMEFEKQKEFGKYTQLVCRMCHCDNLVETDEIEELK